MKEGWKKERGGFVGGKGVTADTSNRVVWAGVPQIRTLLLTGGFLVEGVMGCRQR